MFPKPSGQFACRLGRQPGEMLPDLPHSFRVGGRVLCSEKLFPGGVCRLKRANQQFQVSSAAATDRLPRLTGATDRAGKCFCHAVNPQRRTANLPVRFATNCPDRCRRTVLYPEWPGSDAGCRRRLPLPHRDRLSPREPAVRLRRLPACGAGAGMGAPWRQMFGFEVAGE